MVRNVWKPVVVASPSPYSNVREDKFVFFCLLVSKNLLDMAFILTKLILISQVFNACLHYIILS